MVINLDQFFKLAPKKDFFLEHPVICFKGNEQEYPLLFFSQLLLHIKKTDVMVQTIDLSSQTESSIQSRLQTSFLGQSVFFWMKDFQDLDDAARKKWLGFAQEYYGPNIIAFFISAQSSLALKKEDLVIDIGPSVDQKTFLSCASFFKMTNMANIQVIVGKIFKDQDSMSLDAASLLMYYIQALGSASDIFIATWLEKILKPEKSLFTLSAYLFSKKGKLFFELWSKIENDYAAIFWVAFWSEQVWRAYNFVYLTQQKQYAEAKKISMRLPFTFMQRDYKQFTLQELKQAHDQIYAIDFSLKNGGSQEQLDLFFSKFLSNS